MIGASVRRGLAAAFLAGGLWASLAWGAQDRVTLNFQNAEIESVVKMMSQVTGRNFLLDPRVKGTVTIVSSTPIPREQAYQVFLSALRVQGFAAVEGRGVTKILPEADAKLAATPLFRNGAPRGGGDQIITQIYQLHYESATQLVPVLRPLISPNNYLAAYAATNTLVITDYADNVRRISQIIASIDQPSSGADVIAIRLRYASALDMAQLVSRLMADVSAPGGVQGVPGTPGAPVPAGTESPGARLSIVPDLRTNSLLVRTDNPGLLTRLRGLVATLDVPASGAGNIHVVYLRNAEAVKLADVLRGLLSGETRTSTASGTGTPSLGTTPTTTGTTTGTTMGSTSYASLGAVGGGPAARLSSPEAVMVQADEATNSLIITAPDGIYNALRGVIEKLDVRRAQVYVEALIAEVTEEKAAEFGIQWQAINNLGSGVFGGTNFNQGTNTNILNIAGNPAGVGAGLNLGYINGTLTLPNGTRILNLGALARALESDANANILSTPNLMTLDNAEAKIVVAQNVPFVTGSYAQATSTGTGAAVNPFQTIERRDVGLTLKIKPQISEGGGVKLQIYQEVSSLARSVASDIRPADIVTNKRSLESTVRVDDGDIVVLGGLIQDDLGDNQQAVPILGKIPVLGNLFRYNSRRHTKTNLMVFLRPYVIRDPLAAQAVTSDRYEYIRGQQVQMPVESHPVLPYITPPQLPPFKVNPPAPLSQGRNAPAPVPAPAAPPAEAGARPQ